MYNAEQQQFVERGYGILKINENHDPSEWDRLQARLSKFSVSKNSIFLKFLSYETW